MIIQHTISLLVTFISTITVSAIIGLNPNKKRLHIKYISYILAIGCWSLFHGIAINSNNYDQALMFWKISHYGIILIPTFFSSFVLELDSYLRPKFKSLLKCIVCCYVIIFTTLHSLDILCNGLKAVGNYKYIIRPSNVYHVYLFFWIAIITLSLAILFNCYFRERDFKLKRQYAYFAISMLVAYVGGVTNFFPFYDIYTPLIVTIGTYLVAIHIGIAGYAILARGLMGVDLILKRTFIYTLFILITSVLYMALTYVIHVLLIRQYTYANTLLVNMVVFILIASTFKPVDLFIKNFLDFLSNGDSSGEVIYRSINPKAGLLYELNEDSQIFFNYNKSYEPPTFSEMSTPTGAFRPNKGQVSHTFEVGTRGSAERFGWDATYYHSWLDNELLSVVDVFGNALGTVNAPSETIHQGIELGVNADLLRGILARDSFHFDRINLRILYNWNDFRFNGDPVYGDNMLPGFPEHFFKAEIMYEHPDGYYFGPNLESSFDDYPIDMANTFFADHYTVWGFKAGYRSEKGISYFFEAKNLSDEVYASSTSIVTNAGGLDTNAVFNPGSGKSFFGGIEYRW